MGNFQVAMRRWLRRERARPGSVERLRTSVPIALARIAALREVEDLQAALQSFAEAAQLAVVEVVDSQSARLPAFTWTAPGNAGRQEGEFVSATYPLLSAGDNAYVRFAWATDQGDVTADADILLQLVADACEARLKRSEEARNALAKGHLRSV